MTRRSTRPVRERPRGRRRLLVTLVLAAFPLTIVAAGTPAPPRETAPARPGKPAPAQGDFPALEALEREVAGLIAQARPSVVGIVSKASLGQLLHGLGGEVHIEPESLAKVEALTNRVGTGVILDARGHVATVASAVAGARQVEVILADGARVPGSLIGVDDYSGLAVISIAAERTLTPAALAEGDSLRTGALVAAFSRASGDDAAYSLGFVAGRGVSRGPVRHGPYLKLNAYAAPGAGGGPVFDSRGRLVGILFGAASPALAPRGPIQWKMRTPGQVPDPPEPPEPLDPEDAIDEEAPLPDEAVLDDETLEPGPEGSLWYLRSLHREGSMGGGVSYAIPIDVVRSVTDQIIRSGSVARGWLGVTVESREPGDVRLTRVTSGSPAAVAGLKENDRLLSIDGRRVEEAETVVERVAGAPPGETLAFVVSREGKSIPVRVTLGQRPEPGGSAPVAPRVWTFTGPERPAPPPVLGVIIDAVDEETRRALGAEAGIGLLIESVTQDGAARRGGIREGDLLTHIAGEPIRTLPELRRALRRHDQAQPLEVSLLRDRRPVRVTIRFEAPPAAPPAPPAPPAPAPRR